MALRDGSRRLALIALTAALNGCATADAPREQTVRVQVPGCASALCELANDRGSWRLQAPGSVTVLLSGTPLRVSCRSGEAPAASTHALASRQPTTGTSGLAGGVVGGTATGLALGGTALAFIPPLGVLAVLTGASVGAVAGNVAEARLQPRRYPESITIPMRCSGTDGSADADTPASPAFGLTVVGMTAAQSKAAGLSGRTAVQVVAVAADGAAAAAGLLPGDVLLAADGKDLADAADLQEHLQTRAGPAALALQVWRNGQLGSRVLNPLPRAPR